MSHKSAGSLLLGTALAVLCTTSAFSNSTKQEQVLHYSTALAGHQYPTDTGSAAYGTAKIDIDTVSQTFSARVEVHGLQLSELATHLSHAPVGPMHLHRYQGDDVTLVLPFPMGTSYASTGDGFTVTVIGARYADAARVVNSGLTFDQFIQVLRSDPVYLNLHTEKFGDGEISGRVTASLLSH